MRSRSTWRFVPLVGTLLLVAAACSKSTTGAAASGTPPTSASMTASEMPSGAMPSGEMPLQPGAANMKVKVNGLSPGFVLKSNVLSVPVSTSGYDDSCSTAGKPVTQGQGHYHVLLDGALINMFCGPVAKVSMQNVSPGKHMVEVVPAQNDHAEIMGNAVEVPFTYKPSKPLAEITASSATGDPGIQILEPQDGATLSGDFTVKVAFSNFSASCGLMGKPAVPGYGHWHINIDSMTGPPMGMGTMLGMSCTATFHGSTQGLDAGSTHTLYALLTDNGHAPLNVSDSIQFTVGS